MRSMVLMLLVTARQTASPSPKTTHESPGRATWKRGHHDTTAQKQRALCRGRRSGAITGETESYIALAGFSGGGFFG
jgi:hypothetical protein